MITRRVFIGGIAVRTMIASLAAEAPPAGKIAVVGVLYPGRQPLGLLEAFRQGLRELGYVEGRNLKIEWRFAEGRNERLPQLASELVRLKVDVIFAVNPPAVEAAKSASGTIPIIIARVSDPCRSGLVASLAARAGTSPR